MPVTCDQRSPCKVSETAFAGLHTPSFRFDRVFRWAVTTRIWQRLAAAESALTTWKNEEAGAEKPRNSTQNASGSTNTQSVKMPAPPAAAPAEAETEPRRRNKKVATMAPREVYLQDAAPMSKKLLIASVCSAIVIMGISCASLSPPRACHCPFVCFAPVSLD